MKRILSAVLAAVVIFAAFCFSGCGVQPQNDGKLKIVTTIYPEYEWVKNIVGDAKNVDLSLVVDNGVDLHSFQPTADDIIEISNCDVFVYIGGESDVWVKDAIKEAINKNMKVISLLDVLGENAKEEELVEGMQAEEEETEESEDVIEYDEHIWLSLKNAEKLVKAISDTLIEADNSNKEIYSKNSAEYISKLKALDKDYEDACKAAKVKTLLFGDKFPFRYLTDDYDLKYYAAFIGCSAESEASFETIKFLSDKLNELNLNHILTIESSDGKIAKAIIETSKKSGVDILKLDSMQSTTMTDIETGSTYLDIMTKNLEVLKKALN